MAIVFGTAGFFLVTGVTNLFMGYINANCFLSLFCALYSETKMDKHRPLFILSQIEDVLLEYRVNIL